MPSYVKTLPASFSEEMRVALCLDGLATARGSRPPFRMLGPGCMHPRSGAAEQSSHANSGFQKSGPETSGLAGTALANAARLPVLHRSGTVTHPPEVSDGHCVVLSAFAARFAASAFFHAAFARFTSAAASGSRCANWHWSPFVQRPF